MTTQALTFNHNPQSITWATMGALWATLRTLALLFVCGVAMAAVFAVLAMVPATFWIGALLTLAFALATMPRKVARNV